MIGAAIAGPSLLSHGHTEARFIYRALVALVTQKSLLPRTIVATKTKKGRAACALLWLLLWSCFFYQNAAVFYLNVDGAKFSILAMKKRALAAKITRVFFATQGLPQDVWIR